MTSETRSLAIWGGAAGAIALIGLIWVVVRGGNLAEDRATIHQLETELSKARPDGAQLDTLVAELQKQAKAQADALSETATVLVPQLKPEYQAADLTSATTRVTTDVKALRQRAERTRVTLPPVLPLESGLDGDEVVRQLQLAQLSLYRAALDHLMDAGVTQITTLAKGSSWSDPSATYAILTTVIEFDAPYDVLCEVLQNLLAAHKDGLGVRECTLTVPTAKTDKTTGGKNDGNIHSKMTVSLLIPNKPEWKLVPEKPAAGTLPAAAGKSTSTKPAAAKSSLGDN